MNPASVSSSISESDSRSVSNSAAGASLSESQTVESCGRITINERNPNSRLNRYVDEQMKDWMRDHLDALPETDYEVSFFDEDPIGEISCLVIVQSGETLWRAWQSADNPRMALKRSLQQLHMAGVIEGRLEEGDN